MNRSTMLGVGIAILILIIIASSAIFTVQQAEQALVLQFGDPREVVDQPGLHFKIPLIQTVTYFDRRVLDFDAEAQEVPTLDQKQLIVDAFVRYRILDPLRFFQTVSNERGAQARLGSIVNSALRGVLGDVPLLTVLTPERAALMRRITGLVENDAKGFGIKVLDVRIKRVDLPEQNMEAVIRRMQTQRGQEARKIRAEGDKESRRIHADADMQERVILAEAKKQAEILQGEGDAEAQKIYNAAYSKDPQFFDFWRSMQALSRGLPKDTTSYVGPPEGDFFRYFDSMDGTSDGKKPAAKP
ncbi:MAG TPA: protease modulator HflC [Alphaproteobacteria bacterium]|nr:protease modulator HflC [Alphaproteobacteria bacterium]